VNKHTGIRVQFLVWRLLQYSTPLDRDVKMETHLAILFSIGHGDNTRKTPNDALGNSELKTQHGNLHTPNIG